MVAWTHIITNIIQYNNNKNNLIHNIIMIMILWESRLKG